MTSILEGVKVLDFGRYIAGPFCGALLADYGAEVIRIERTNLSKSRLNLFSGALLGSSILGGAIGMLGERLQ